jgi:hypothetical protein
LDVGLGDDRGEQNTGWVDARVDAHVPFDVVDFAPSKSRGPAPSHRRPT